MPKIVDAEVWVGRTKGRGIYRVYVIGKKPRGLATVWILGSAEARQSGLPGFPAQGDGFQNEAAAEAFALRAFASAKRLDEFISYDLNPLPLNRVDAPELVTKVDVPL